MASSNLPLTPPHSQTQWSDRHVLSWLAVQGCGEHRKLPLHRNPQGTAESVTPQVGLACLGGEDTLDGIHLAKWAIWGPP